MTTRPVAHHYSYFLKAGGPKLTDIRNTGPLGPIYKLSLELPRDIGSLRLRQSMTAAAATVPKSNVGSALSETIALHQRKLRVTEARIDHALDLVTRSFGVTQSAPEGFTLTTPNSAQVREVKETLTRTQRFLSSDRKARSRSAGGSGESTARATTTRSPASRGLTKQHAEIESLKSNNKASSAQSPAVASPAATAVATAVKIYKSNPVAAPINSLNSTKKVLSKDKIDRNKITQLCVVLGNTHVYEETPSDFTNTFAKMESFKAFDDGNAANRPRYRVKVDMGGFLDNEITLQCDGKKVIITGNRPKKSANNARRVLEVLELPPGIFPEKLRIARDNHGVLHVEERWTLD